MSEAVAARRYGALMVLASGGSNDEADELICT
jgi:hypothetical protein